MNAIVTPVSTEESDALRFNCPKCNARYKVLQQHLGRRTTCVKCRELITVNLPAPDAVHNRQVVAPPQAPIQPKAIIEKSKVEYPSVAHVGERLETWQYVVGIGLCAIPPFPFLTWSLLGAITLRAAYSICVSRNSVLGFDRAWWISIVALLSSSPVTIFNIALAVSIPELAIPVGILIQIVSASIFCAVYQTTLGVTYRQGMLMWLLQFLVNLCLCLVVTAAIFQLA